MVINPAAVSGASLAKMLEMPEPRKSRQPNGWHGAVAAPAVNQGRSWIHALTHWPSQPTA